MKQCCRLIISLAIYLALCVFASSVAYAKTEVALKEGVLLAAFGTSVPEAKVSFQHIEQAFQQSQPDATLVWTYTSETIRKKLAKEGEHIPGIAEALQQLARSGVRTLRIQPLHLMAGEEYTELERAVLLAIKRQGKRFTSVYIGRPLLESREDARIVGKALLKHLAPKRSEQQAIVLMGHGQEKGRAGLTLEGVRSVLHTLDPLVFIASVEGERGFDDLLADLKASQVRKVLLVPFMLVAGDHARNDLAGDEDDSWKSKLIKEGFEVSTHLEGLGLLPEVAGLYIRHARESRDDLMTEPRKQ